MTSKPSDRWRWFKLMLAQPRNVLSDGTKIVLAAIWEARNEKTRVTVRLQSTLAEATGMTESGVRAAIAKARDAGWIETEGKGGIVWDETGRRVPIASRYTLKLPATAIAAYTVEDLSNPLPDRGLPAMETGVTRYGGSDNTPLDSSLDSPLDSSGLVGAEEDEPFTAFLHPGQCRNIIGIHVARMLGRVTEGTSDADRFAVGARTASEIPELDHLISRMREGDLRPSDLIAIADRMRRAA